MILLEHSNAESSGMRSSAPVRFNADYSGGLCGRLNDKWTVVVLWRISEASGHRVRSSLLKQQLNGITQRMLTLTLRNLERDGLVARHLFAEVPPRVEYELTDLGGSLLTALQSVNRWITDNMPRVDQCRLDYDTSDKGAKKR